MTEKYPEGENGTNQKGNLADVKTHLTEGVDVGKPRKASSKIDAVFERPQNTAFITVNAITEFF